MKRERYSITDLKVIHGSLLTDRVQHLIQEMGQDHPGLDQAFIDLVEKLILENSDYETLFEWPNSNEEDEGLLDLVSAPVPRLLAGRLVLERPR